jgi:hypothetical protein
VGEGSPTDVRDLLFAGVDGRPAEACHRVDEPPVRCRPACRHGGPPRRRQTGLASLRHRPYGLYHVRPGLYDVDATSTSCQRHGWDIHALYSRGDRGTSTHHQPRQRAWSPAAPGATGGARAARPAAGSAWTEPGQDRVGGPSAHPGDGGHRRAPRRMGGRVLPGRMRSRGPARSGSMNRPSELITPELIIFRHRSCRLPWPGSAPRSGLPHPR